MRVLYIEDYSVLRESVSACLREEAFAVDAVADSKEGLWMARENPYDVIVLDLTMPGMDGLEVLRRLREEGCETPILITSARDAIGQRVEGLGLGADDYLVKPFALEELVARVRTLVRRGYGTSQPVTRIGDMELDASRKEVRRSGEIIPLTLREYALLEYLAIRKGQIVSRTDIWEHVYEYYSSATSNVVDVYVGYLRQKLNAGGRENLIQTRRGFGYVLEESH